MFGGRKINLIDTRLSLVKIINVLLLLHKLSIISRLHSSNNMPCIQLFFWLQYQQEKCFTRLKRLGNLGLSMTNIGNFPQSH